MLWLGYTTTTKPKSSGTEDQSLGQAVSEVFFGSSIGVISQWIVRDEVVTKEFSHLVITLIRFDMRGKREWYSNIKWKYKTHWGYKELYRSSGQSHLDFPAIVGVLTYLIAFSRGFKLQGMVVVQVQDPFFPPQLSELLYTLLCGKICKLSHTWYMSHLLSKETSSDSYWLISPRPQLLLSRPFLAWEFYDLVEYRMRCESFWVILSHWES